ncbi:MAG: HIT domain-containing protein [Actinomycetota bacterium]|nr:HIT domain-containing protein [Actinomycetota bacterium]
MSRGEPGLERLWAGWRREYVSGDHDEEHDGCLLCRVVDEASTVVWRGSACAAVLNAFPYTSGHLMVMPVRHVGELEDVEGEEAAELWAAVADAVRALKAAYGPDGINIGANLGRAAGAGVPGHFHVHVLPRWSGDTNFMTSVAEARVLPESLDATHEKVKGSWPS